VPTEIELHMEYFAHIKEGENAARRGDEAAALAAFGRALKVAERLGSADVLAGCWSTIGTHHMRAKAYADAATAYGKALAPSRASGNRHGLAVCLRNLAEAERYDHRFADALAHASESLRIYSEIGNRPGAAAATRARARNLEELGRLGEALAAYTDARERYVDLAGSDEAIATCDHRIGVILNTTEGGAGARKYLLRALAAARKADQRGFALDVLNDIALSHAFEGDYATALRHLLDVLSEARKVPHADSALAACLNNLGRISLQQHDSANAVRYFTEAVEIARRLDHKARLVIPLANLGRSHEVAMQLDRALDVYAEALSVALGSSQLALTAFCYCSIGRTLSDAGRYDEALAALAEGTRVADGIGDKRQAAELRHNTAVAHLRRGEMDKALQAVGEACARARELAERDSLAAYLTTAGIALIAGGRQAEAGAALEEAVNLLEELRAATSADRQAQLRSFDSDVTTYHLFLEEVLLPGGDLDRAVETLERSKSRLLWDLAIDRQLAQARARGSAHAERLERLDTRRRSLEFLLGDRLPGKESTVRTWLSEREEILAEIDALTRRSADDADAAGNELVRSSDQLRGVLSPRTAVVEFFVGQQSVVALVWDQAEDFQLVRFAGCTPVRVKKWAAALRRSTGMYASEGAVEGARATMDEVLRDVYDCCIAEILRTLSENTDHVILVPHQELHALPFHAAFHVENGRRVYWLEEGRTVSYAPSSSLLRSCCRRARPPATHLVAIANPTRDLPAAEREVTRVAQLYSSATILGAGATAPATRSVMMSEVRGAHVVLCTGHGCTGTMTSAVLALSGESLSIRDQYIELDLPSCTLWDSDCCESALSETRGGDDWITLASAPLVAGARTVWSTLWVVNDEATAALKVAAYGAAVHERLPFSSALNAAQRAALAGEIEWFDVGERNRHPLFWAPFVSVGAP
jgi:CHAT domain-containing protein